MGIKRRGERERVSEIPAFSMFIADMVDSISVSRECVRRTERPE